MALVPTLAKEDTTNETVFSKLTDKDRTTSCGICEDMAGAVRDAFKKKASLLREVRAAKKKQD